MTLAVMLERRAVRAWSLNSCRWLSASELQRSAQSAVESQRSFTHGTHRRCCRRRLGLLPRTRIAHEHHAGPGHRRRQGLCELRGLISTHTHAQSPRHWLRTFAAEHGLMHIFVTDRNARHIAPFITKPRTKTLLANTAELTVLLREGRNGAAYAEHAFICAIYPESLTLCGLDAQTSSLWHAINVCRLRKLVFSKIHWLSYAMIHLMDSCSNTLATLI